MKNTFLLFVVILFSNNLLAQDLKLIELPRGARVESTIIIDGITTHSYSSYSKIPVNGTPFLFDDFKSGILELKDGKSSQEVQLRYNVSTDIFEIDYNNDTLSLNRPFDVRYIYLGEKKFIYDLYFMESKSGKRNGYFEIVSEGTLSLFMKRNKDLSYDSFVSTYKGGGGTKEYYYVDKISFFCRTDKDEPFLVKSSKSFLNGLPKNKSEMKDFIKSNKIKFKKKADLVLLVEYYDSL